MNRWWILGLGGIWVFAGCGDEVAEVTIDETRELTSKDGSPKLFATSDERFRNTRPSPVTGVAPQGWQAVPGSQFRVLNYRFGESGKGEVYVTLAGGGVLGNVNRWLGQFGAEAIDAEGLAALRRVSMLEGEGVWVEAAGTFGGGMGRAAAEGFALAGVIAERGGRIVTVKMIGPAQEVEAQKSALESFAATLKLAE